MRHKSVDLDGVGALDLDRFELRILNDEVLALGHLVAAAFVLGGDRLAGLFIDELPAQAIAGGLVDLPEGDALGTRAGRQRPRSRTMLVLVQVSSININRAGSNMPCCRIQPRRARAISARFCSAAFF